MSKEGRKEKGGGGGGRRLKMAEDCTMEQPVLDVLSATQPSRPLT